MKTSLLFTNHTSENELVMQICISDCLCQLKLLDVLISVSVDLFITDCSVQADELLAGADSYYGIGDHGSRLVYTLCNCIKVPLIMCPTYCVSPAGDEGVFLIYWEYQVRQKVWWGLEKFCGILTGVGETTKYMGYGEKCHNFYGV